jgi:hypothetical protein
MINKVIELRKKYGNTVISIMMSPLEMKSMALKTKINEYPNYWPHVKERMAESIRRGIPFEKRMIVVPQIFSVKSKLKMSAKL